MQCSICFRAFSRREHLNRHMLSHMQLKPFECSSCTACFARRDALRRHQVTVHRHNSSHAGQHDSFSQAVSASTGSSSSPPSLPTLPAKRRRAEREQELSLGPQQLGKNMVAPFSFDLSTADVELGTETCDLWALFEPAIATDEPHTVEGSVHGQHEFLSPWDVTLLSTSENPIVGPPDEQITDFIDASPSFLTLSDSREGLQSPHNNYLSPSWEEFADFLGQFDRETPQRQIDLSIATWMQWRQSQGSPEPTVAKQSLPSLSLLSRSLDPVASGLWDAKGLRHVPALEEATYQRLAQAYTSVKNASAIWQIQIDGDFPPLSLLNSCIQLYFEHVHPCLPLLHKPTFNPNSDYWLLTFAVSVSGCNFSMYPHARQCLATLQEVLRRAILVQMETNPSVGCRLDFGQAVLLSHLGLSKSDRPSMIKLFEINRGLLTSLCHKNRCFHEMYQQPPVVQTIHDRWHSWIKAELSRRLGYCTWLHDSEQAMFGRGEPCIPTESIRTRLPCSEDEWEARSAPEWLIEHTARSAHNLRADKALIVETADIIESGNWSEEHGLFTYLVLAMSIFRSGRGHKAYLRASADMEVVADADSTASNNSGHHPHYVSSDDISRTTARTSADHQASIHALSSLSRLFRKSPSFALDAAHPRLRLAVVECYHAAQLLLRVPIHDLLHLGGWRCSMDELVSARGRVQTWICSNGHEARRAAVHASKVFNHMRSSDLTTWIAPCTLIPACIYLWAFTQYDLMNLDTPHFNPETNFAIVPTSESTKAPMENTISQLEESKEDETPVLRLEKLSEISEDKDSWIVTGKGFRVHLGGVGSLSREPGLSRLMQEVTDVFLRCGYWPITKLFGLVTRLLFKANSHGF